MKKILMSKNILILSYLVMVFFFNTCGNSEQSDDASVVELKPEIDITQNNVSLVSVTGSYDFGGVIENTSSAPVTFVIENKGTASLELTSAISKSGINAEDFSIDQSATSTTIPSGDSTTFSITFSPTSIGSKTATITISNSDSDEGTYTFTITGPATPPVPEINVRQSSRDIESGIGSYDFESVANNISSPEVIFTIENVGTATLTLTSDISKSGTNADEFSIDQSSTSSTIIENDNTSFSIIFTPIGTGVKSATITIPNDDSDEGTYVFTVVGTGYKPSTVVIADTGQTNCYNISSLITCPNPGESFFGQDGNYVDIPNARSFSGPNQHSMFSSDYTTTDNVTGLIWTSCSIGQSGSDCSTGSLTTHTWEDAKTQCDNLNTLNGGAGYANLADWHLPTITELETLLDYGKISPTIDTTYFPNAHFSFHWSSTLNRRGLTSLYTAWVVYFGLALTNDDTVTSDNYVRCVSSGS